MEYKALKYHNKNKKVRQGSITDYQSLRSTVQKAFSKDLQQDFIIYYFDEDEPYDVENQDDFDMMVENPRKIIIYVRNKGQEPINSNEVSILSSHASNILNESIKEESQRFVDALQDRLPKKIEKQAFPVQATIKLTREQNTKPQQKSQPIVKKQEHLKQLIKQQYHQPPILSSQNMKFADKIEQQLSIMSNRSTQIGRKQQMKPVVKKQKLVDLSIIHKGTKCQVCQSKNIKGIRWKCLDLTNYDICDECYTQQKYKATKEHKNKSYVFVGINDTNFQKRINFSHSIRKVFDHNYKASVSHPVLGQWITEQDMMECNPNFVKAVWEYSRDMEQNILSKFDDWQKTSSNSLATQQ